MNNLDNHCNEWCKFDPPPFLFNTPLNNDIFMNIHQLQFFTNPEITDLRYIWAHSRWTTTFTLDTYVYFGQVRSLSKGTFVLDKCIHFKQLRSLWNTVFTLVNNVHFGQLRLLWRTTFTLDNYVHFGQLRLRCGKNIAAIINTKPE